ncbi:MAG: valine--tRNA ligase, partial [Candidatus Kapaibacteriota bacterium]
LFLVKGNQIRILDKVEESLNSITSIVRDVEIHVLIGKDIDLTKEIERISKEIERLQNNILVINKKLNNPTFLEKAKPEVIEKEKIKLGSMTETLNKLEVLFTKLKKQ